MKIKNKDSIVIVISTSSLDSADVARIVQYPTDEYVVKPLTEEKITYIIEKYLN